MHEPRADDGGVVDMDENAQNTTADDRATGPHCSGPATDQVDIIDGLWMSMRPAGSL